MRGPILALPPRLPRHVLNYDKYTITLLVLQALYVIIIFQECIVTNCSKRLVSILGKDLETVTIYLYIYVTFMCSNTCLENHHTSDLILDLVSTNLSIEH